MSEFPPFDKRKEKMSDLIKHIGFIDYKLADLTALRLKAVAELREFTELDALDSFIKSIGESHVNIR